MVRFNPATMLRGMAKIIAIAFVINQILTTIFTYFARQIDATLPHETIWMFSCVTCGLVTLWLQSDARRAFGFARENGYIKPADDTKQIVQIAPDCPKRWLVILHMELNPAATGVR
jgi:hypothetical protein